MSSSSNIYLAIIYHNVRQFEGKMKTMKIKCGTAYNKLNERINQKLGIKCSQCIHRLIARYETIVGNDTIYYIGNDINDDEDVECVIDVFVDRKVQNFIEIYVEVDFGQPSSLPMYTSTSQYFGQEDKVVGLSAPAQMLSQIILEEGEENEVEEKEEEDMDSDEEGKPESVIPLGDTSDTDVEGDFDIDMNPVNFPGYVTTSC